MTKKTNKQALSRSIGIALILILGLAGYIILLNTAPKADTTPPTKTAILKVSPTTGSQAIDSTFPVDFKLDTGGKNVNLVGVEVDYSTNLEFVSFDAANSVMTSSISDPAPNNNHFKIERWRTALGDPGFNGPDGQIMKVLFKAKTAGTGTVTINPTTSTVFDADNPNGSILKSVVNGSFTLGTVPTNQPPTVSLTAPANNATFTAPATINITADAADSDGTVSKVEFFQGTTKLGEDTTSPYSYAWTNVAAGSYSLTAKAADNATPALTTTSAARTITVNGDTPPTVDLTAPANNATFTAPATVNLTANASDTGGSIAKVEFFQGTTKLGEDTSSPYAYSWTNVGAGSYSLTAKATDNTAKTTTSTVRTITVTRVNQPPTVSLTAPNNNQTFNAGANITVSADAADSDGSIAKVEFFRGTTSLGIDTSSPYTVTWTNAPAGSYSLTAKATDSDNTVVTSAARSITVQTTPPAASACFVIRLANRPANQQAISGIYIEVDNPDNSNNTSIDNVSSDTTGKITIADTAFTGSLNNSATYSVKFKPNGYLQSKITSVSNILGSCVTFPTTKALAEGDFDDDNKITLFDIERARAAYIGTADELLNSVYQGRLTLPMLERLRSNYVTIRNGE